MEKTQKSGGLSRKEPMDYQGHPCELPKKLHIKKTILILRNREVLRGLINRFII